MRTRNKKLKVLHQLSQESEPISLFDLLGKLGKEYTERSLRRWLTDMIKEGIVEKIGHKRATKYRVIQHTNQNNSTHGCFSSRSIKIIDKIRRPIYERMPVSYDESWINSYSPNQTFYIPSKLRSQLLKAGKRSQNQDPAGTYAREIFNRLLIDLSYNSSRLEGNTYSWNDTERLLLKGVSAKDKMNEETIMILNHKEAIRYLVDTAPKLEITKESICTLHFLLADGLIESHYTGKLRNMGVRIGGSTYIPFENIKKLDSHLEQITKKAAQIDDPYEQSLFLLIHISYLQAFIDVNKRTARLSANIPLIKNNLVPLSFNYVNREDYTSAIIAIYELQNVRPLLDVFVFSYLRTCAMYDSTVKSMGFDEIRVRYRQQRRALIRDIILKKIVENRLHKFILSQAKILVKKNDRPAFVEDVLEDLKEIDHNRIVGLGITSKELDTWLKKAKIAD